MTAAGQLWVTCPDWTAGPYRGRAAAQRAADRADGAGVCQHPHQVTVAAVRPVPAWQDSDDGDSLGD